MAKNRYKNKNMAQPIENHQTAAWANRKELKPASQVNIPDLEQVENAKDYVDSNQK
ncbi:MAG: DUF3787 domain-containing protein [Tissierellia bacterium]|nr:DUF3787 domain-containing protein [Tissierellia bacterium]